jgi:hypothetical protein
LIRLKYTIWGTALVAMTTASAPEKALSMASVRPWAMSTSWTAEAGTPRPAAPCSSSSSSSNLAAQCYSCVRARRRGEGTLPLQGACGWWPAPHLGGSESRPDLAELLRALGQLLDDQLAGAAARAGHHHLPHGGHQVGALQCSLGQQDSASSSNSSHAAAANTPPLRALPANADQRDAAPCNHSLQCHRARLQLIPITPQPHAAPTFMVQRACTQRAREAPVLATGVPVSLCSMLSSTGRARLCVAMTARARVTAAVRLTDDSSSRAAARDVRSPIGRHPGCCDRCR